VPDPCDLERHGARLAPAGVHVDPPAARAARARLVDERARARQRHRRSLDVGAALEPVRSLRREPEPLAGAPHDAGLEPRALERDATRVRLRHLGVAAAHDPGDGRRARGVGDDEHVGGQRTLLAVERCQALAGLGQPHADLAPAEPRLIEGVHRVAELEQHVVGDVDQVVDGAHAGRRETPLHPLGRGADLHVGQRAAVAAAPRGIVDDDAEVVAEAGRAPAPRDRRAPGRAAAARSGSPPRAPCRRRSGSRDGSP
jgi:hypothetical protein